MSINTLRPRQNGHHLPDDILKWIFLNENVWISIKISLKFFPKGPINNIPALVQIMAWRRPGDKPLYVPMMVCLLTHICVTRPQWVKVSQITCNSTVEASIRGIIKDMHFLHAKALNTWWWEIDIHGYYSLVKITFAPICTSKTINKYDIIMPVSHVCLTSQINCDDITILSQKRLL